MSENNLQPNHTDDVRDTSATVSIHHVVKPTASQKEKPLVEQSMVDAALEKTAPALSDAPGDPQDMFGEKEV